MTDEIDDSSKSKQVNCKSIVQKLSKIQVRGYEEIAVGGENPVNYALSLTTWTLEYIDADFILSKRAFTFQSSSVLQVLYDVAEVYNAVLLFNTENKTVRIQKPEFTGLNRGLTTDYGKLMSSMSNTIESTEMITRLNATGSDGLTIQRANPTGKIYLENYNYWMFPFERDSNKNIIKHSIYMSDSLCHALMDYSELVESKRGQFKGYLEQLELLETSYSALLVEMDKLKNDEAVIEEIQITQQYDQKMFYEKYIQSGTTTRTFNLKPEFAYGFFIKVNNGSGMTVRVNGQAYPTVDNNWVLLVKLRNIETGIVEIQGGSGQVFIQVANISLDEWNESGNPVNDAKLVEKYSLDNKQNQILLKQVQINNILNQIESVQILITNLQNTLSENNNFTVGQLKELNDYLSVGEFSDDVYIDSQDLYDAASEKFLEMQKPVIEVNLSLVNFLEILEEQINWDKLSLGDFVNVRYKPLGIKLEARITEIQYDFEERSISVTLSNAKDVNDESKKFEKYLADSKDAIQTIGNNKNPWTQAVTDSSYFSRLFDQFYDKITNQINMSINNTVTINNMGITVSEPNDPLRFIRITNGQIGITRSGGLRYETALDAYGIIAETVYGKIILGQRVVVGSDDGIFTIEGPTLTIQDRCLREISKYGLLSSNPDVFGITFNRLKTPSICSDATILNKIGITNADGFYIDKVVNGIDTRVLSLGLEGDIYAISMHIKDSFITDGEIRGGSLWIGDENTSYILKMQQSGFWIGHKYFDQAPFSVTLDGHLKANGADFTDSIFVDGDITGSTITAGSGENIIKLDPSIGFWAGASNFTNAPASIGLDGTAKFKKLIVTDGDGELLIDSENKVVNANGFDFVGVGALETDLLSANIVTADDGNITDLIAGKLSTLTNAALNGYSNYITISGKDFKFITGRVSGQGTQKTLSDGRKLYWVSSTKTGKMTTETTPYPVMMYEMEEKEKLRFYFEGSGEAAYPIIKMGEGGGGNNSIGYIRKPATSFEFEYLDNFGSKKNLIFNDDILELNASRKNLKIIQSDKNTIIELKDDGSLSISVNGGVGTAVCSPTGVWTHTGTRHNFNS